MNCTNATLSYKKTGYFSGLVTDYVEQASTLRPFYKQLPNLQGIKDAIAARKKSANHRRLLVTALQQQYAAIATGNLVKQQIDSLLQDNTFTITTAHQPAIFTGTLYFIYKIIHAIKLAEQLKQEMPEYNFVPVYYMGSEDADLDELGKIYLGNEKIVWDTKQTGAVGRMNTKGLEKIINRIDGELSVQPHGKELVQLLRDCYAGTTDIQTATFKLINTLFAEYGLIVLIPDNASLKSVMQRVFEDDLFHQTPSAVVGKTIEKLSEHYKVQANPRDINLFYLKDNKRERIEVRGTKYEVLNTDISFSADEITAAFSQHPERFSPNVILRGLFQETILPNIAFIGGGGETAYWLELKDLFEHYHVPYPVLVLRNSFLIVEKKWSEKMAKLGFNSEDFFSTEQELLTKLVSRHKNGELKLKDELTEVQQLYLHLKEKAGSIDKTLEQHIEALQARTIRPLQELEKKMLRAAKRKYEAEQRQIHAVKTALFPLNGLQERIENFMPYYAKWGKDFISLIHQHSLTLEQQFMLLEEK